MEEKLSEILEQEIQDLTSRRDGLRETMIAVQEEEENIQEEIIAGLLRDKKQLEEAIEKEKADYIKAEYNSDLERVNQAIDNWEQSQLQEILGIEREIEDKKEEKATLEEYRGEKPQNDAYNQNIAERRTELEHRRIEAEVALNELTRNGTKTFFRGQSVEKNEIENDLANISTELERIDNEQEKENNRFSAIEIAYNDLCDKYNVKEIMKQEAEQEKARQEAEQEQAKHQEEEEEKRRKAAEEHYNKLAEELKKQAEQEKAETARQEAEQEEAKLKVAKEEKPEPKIKDISKALEEQAKLEAEKGKEKDDIARILQEEIEAMDEDLGSSATRLQEPERNTIGEDFSKRTGKAPKAITPEPIKGKKPEENKETGTSQETPAPRRERLLRNREEIKKKRADEIKNIEDLLKGKNFKITIGSNGILEREGVKRFAGEEDFKKGATLNLAYCNEINSPDKIKQVAELIYPKDIADLIVKCHHNNVPMDFTIISSILSKNINIGQMEKEALIKGYLMNMLKAHYEHTKTSTLAEYEDMKKIEGIEIVYNMKSLSKPLPFLKTLCMGVPILGKIFSNNADRQLLLGSEKERIAELAGKSKEYKVGKIVGKYKYDDKSLTARILRFFNKDKKLLPAPQAMESLLAAPNSKNIREELPKEYARLKEEGVIGKETPSKAVEGKTTDGIRSTPQVDYRDEK